MTREQVKECKCPVFVQGCAHFGDQIVVWSNTALDTARPEECQECGAGLRGDGTYVVEGPIVVTRVCPTCETSWSSSVVPPTGVFTDESTARAEFDARCARMLAGGGA